LFILYLSPSTTELSASFNPSVGILFVHTCGRPNRTQGAHFVSIPRSGFCLFILVRRSTVRSNGCSFNPSVGILFVHTYEAVRVAGAFNKFQSLGRDSVCSYVCKHCGEEARSTVSIPRSGFCLFILASAQCAMWRPSRFNPSVGILFVHTLVTSAVSSRRARFQSLGRDSVCSYSGMSSSSRSSGSFNPSVGILFVHT